MASLNDFCLIDFSNCGFFLSFYSCSLQNEKKGSAENDNAPSEPPESESLETVKQESLEIMKQELLEPVKQESPEPVKTESLEPVQIKTVKQVKQELLEPEKQAPLDTEKLKETNVTMNQETEEPANPIEQTYKPEPVYVAPGKIESVQSIEVESASEVAAAVNVPETQNKETSADYKEGKTEVAK